MVLALLPPLHYQITDPRDYQEKGNDAHPIKVHE
jgi:hypothetical protein